LNLPVVVVVGGLARDCLVALVAGVVPVQQVAVATPHQNHLLKAITERQDSLSGLALAVPTVAAAVVVQALPLLIATRAMAAMAHLVP
jgi:hypothetical protein